MSEGKASKCIAEDGLVAGWWLQTPSYSLSKFNHASLLTVSFYDKDQGKSSWLNRKGKRQCLQAECCLYCVTRASTAKK